MRTFSRFFLLFFIYYRIPYAIRVLERRQFQFDEYIYHASKPFRGSKIRWNSFLCLTEHFIVLLLAFLFPCSLHFYCWKIKNKSIYIYIYYSLVFLHILMFSHSSSLFVLLFLLLFSLIFDTVIFDRYIPLTVNCSNKTNSDIVSPSSCVLVLLFRKKKPIERSKYSLAFTVVFSFSLLLSIDFFCFS